MGQGKLVRDKIPQIIRDKGLEPVIYVAGPDEYATRLRDKLTEEVAEFLDSDSDPEELADVLEVVYALAALTGTDRQQLEKLRAAKADERGGFADRVIWSGNQPRSSSRVIAHTDCRRRPRLRTPATAGSADGRG
jgi:predicted house-cleaning noncanonical NTP pyrophosphatase (MazG superfamily)